MGRVQLCSIGSGCNDSRLVFCSLITFGSRPEPASKDINESVSKIVQFVCLLLTPSGLSDMSSWNGTISPVIYTSTLTLGQIVVCCNIHIDIQHVSGTHAVLTAL